MSKGRSSKEQRVPGCVKGEEADGTDILLSLSNKVLQRPVR